ncbi:MAG TPA: acyl carrier protein [Bryobacteraceae bacterium]|nr:acyl carrier protein [Bryobacteraceae bacterium]
MKTRLKTEDRLLMDKRTKIATIVQRLSVAPVDPAPEESLFQSGVLDSFQLMDLVLILESEFGIRVRQADLVPCTFDSITRIEAYVESRS